MTAAPVPGNPGRSLAASRRWFEHAPTDGTGQPQGRADARPYLLRIMSMKCVVTGAAGFIGSHLCERLLRDGHEVVGVDAFVPFYPRAVKEANLAAARTRATFTLLPLDLRTDDLGGALDGVEAVFHLAAMPGLPRS